MYSQLREAVLRHHVCQSVEPSAQSAHSRLREDGDLISNADFWFPGDVPTFPPYIYSVKTGTGGFSDPKSCIPEPSHPAKEHNPHARRGMSNSFTVVPASVLDRS